MMIDVSADDGTFKAHLAMPPSGQGPGIVLLQEIFGINAYMRQMADLFAAEGFMAVVPDLFWRMEPGVDLDYGERDQAVSFMQRFDPERALGDIAATVAATRALPGNTGRVGAVGYCLGGKLAVLAAARCGVDAAVGYYGVGIEGVLDDVRGAACPLMLHFGELDRYGPPEVLARIGAALAGRPDASMFVYPGADHGFNSASRASFNPVAALVAHRRTGNMLSRALRGEGASSGPGA